MGRWTVRRPSVGDGWDVIFFDNFAATWTQGVGASKFHKLGMGSWVVAGMEIKVTWREDLSELWPLPLRLQDEHAMESDGKQLIASKAESAKQNRLEQFTD